MVKEEEQTEKRNFQCMLCNKLFRSRRGLLVHFQKLHVQKDKLESLPKISCHEPDCTFSCCRLQDLRTHLSQLHGFSFTQMIKHFSNNEEFLAWLRSFEKRNDVEFFRSTMNNNAKSKVVYYRCNRSGFYKSKSRKKRSAKMQGSCKIGGHCTAFVKTKEEFKTGIVTMTICNTHYGHALELKHLRVPKEDKIIIAENFQKGLSNLDILKELKKTAPPTAERTNFVKDKDVRNVISKIASSQVNSPANSCDGLNPSKVPKSVEETTLRNAPHKQKLVKDVDKLKRSIASDVNIILKSLETFMDFDVLKIISKKVKLLCSFIKVELKKHGKFLSKCDVKEKISLNTDENLSQKPAHAPHDNIESDFSVSMENECDKNSHIIPDEISLSVSCLGEDSQIYTEPSLTLITDPNTVITPMKSCIQLSVPQNLPSIYSYFDRPDKVEECSIDTGHVEECSIDTGHVEKCSIDTGHGDKDSGVANVMALVSSDESITPLPTIGDNESIMKSLLETCPSTDIYENFSLSDNELLQQMLRSPLSNY